MTSKRRTIAVAMILDLLLLGTFFAISAYAGPTTGQSSADSALRQAQKALLDPHADVGDHPELTDPHNHVGEVAPQTGGGSAAQDVTGQTTIGTATPPLAAQQGGRWALAPQLPSGFYAIHVVVGVKKILLVAGSGNDAHTFAAGTFNSYVCSATLSNCHLISTPDDLFCSGHVLLPDGRALVGGGTLAYGAWKGAKYLYAFNFNTETYQKLQPLEVGRWYPSLITTINGQTLITGGIDENGALTGTTELFDYRTNSHHLLPGSRLFPLYPRIYLTARLDYFYSGVGLGGFTGKVSPGFWVPTTPNSFKPVSGLRTPSQRSNGASCFVGDLRNQDMLVMGGGFPAIATTDRIKLTATKPAYVPGPTLKAKKEYLSCLTLPDGTLLEAGGGTDNLIETASYEVGLLKSINSQWTSMNPIPTGNDRVYHSSFFLLDDGRVVSIGSNPKNEARSTSVLIYSPPYLFKGTRPTITRIPSTIKRYSTISVGTTGGATRLTFTKPPSPTHGSEPNEGYMSFPIVNGRVDLKQGLARYLPSGHYRVWAVSSKGAVSVATWVYLA